MGCIRGHGGLYSTGGFLGSFFRARDFLSRRSIDAWLRGFFRDAAAPLLAQAEGRGLRARCSPIIDLLEFNFTLARRRRTRRCRLSAYTRRRLHKCDFIRVMTELYRLPGAPGLPATA